MASHQTLINQELYSRLKKAKKPNESVSDTIDRLLRRQLNEFPAEENTLSIPHLEGAYDGQRLSKSQFYLIDSSGNQIDCEYNPAFENSINAMKKEHIYQITGTIIQKPGDNTTIKQIIDIKYLYDEIEFNGLKQKLAARIEKIYEYGRDEKYTYSDYTINQASKFTIIWNSTQNLNNILSSIIY